MSRLRDETGFTLVELMVAMVLMLIVMSAALTTLEQFTHMSKRSERRVDMQEQARNATRQMARTLRNVAGSSETSDVIERAEDFDLVFKVVDDSGAAAGDNAQRLERVRYCVGTSSAARNKIYVQEQAWTGAAAPAVPPASACPSTTWGSSRVLAEDVTNRTNGSDRALWTYRFADGQVAAVSINLFMDENTTAAPGETALRTGVFLRNQNRAPLASFTATPAGVYHVLLNASASYDPEGHPLDVSWTVGGEEIGSGVNLDWDARYSGSRTVTLTVTDPAGLSDSMSQTVVVP